MTKRQLDPLSVLAILARMHGTTLEEEIEKHNATLRPMATPEEAAERREASKRRALDKMKAKRAAVRASKPRPTAEEIAAKTVARAEGKKASARRHRVKARDALRALRAKTGRLHGGGPPKGQPASERRVLTADEKRARKAEGDMRYRLAARDALRALRR